MFEKKSPHSRRRVCAIPSSDFDVFLCHNFEDKNAVKKIARRLRSTYSLSPWLDEWEIRPGIPFIGPLEEQISKIRSAAVFIGASGVGPWQLLEIEALLREFVRRRCPVIPVILPSAPQNLPQLPLFLRGMMWVDFRKSLPNPMEQLVWGITGQRSNGRVK